MLGNGVLRGIFGPKKGEITGECRKLHNEESVLPTKYHSGDQIKKNELGRACSTYGRQEMCLQGFGGER